MIGAAACAGDYRARRELAQLRGQLLHQGGTRFEMGPHGACALGGLAKHVC